MIRREDMNPGAWEAMCMPINEVLPADDLTHTGALFIGSWFASVDTDLLKRYKIRQIVAVLDEAMSDCLPEDGRRTYNIPLEDSIRAELKPHLEGACKCIAENLKKGNNVLVHCQQGISRSAAIIVAYLMREKGMNYDDALNVVRSKRLCVKPNLGFEKTLREWGEELKGKKK